MTLFLGQAVIEQVVVEPGSEVHLVRSRGVSDCVLRWNIAKKTLFVFSSERG